MKRRLVSSLAALSLMLIVALTIRSLFATEWIVVTLSRGAEHDIRLMWRSWNGGVGMAVVSQANEGASPRFQYGKMVPLEHWDDYFLQPGVHNVIGFRYGVNVEAIGQPTKTNLGLVVYLPMLHVIIVVSAAAVLVAVLNHRRSRWGRCRACGYDLRATPDRCPECGTAVAPKPAEAAA